jgi:hypothetical protein
MQARAARRWSSRTRPGPHILHRHDALELALKRHKEGKTQLWILCVDDTRIVPPAARTLLNFPSRTRDQTERHLLTLLESWNGARTAN